MNWEDEEFEAFLRQFPPRKLKALPNPTRSMSILAAAAAVMLAAAISVRLGFPGAAWDSSSGASRPSPITSPANERTGAPATSGTLGAVSPPSEGASTATRVRAGGSIKPPIRLVNVDPAYPEDVQAARIEGVVVLDIVIGQDGSVIQVQVVRSVPQLDEMAIDAVSQWKYQPTLLNGEPIEVQMNVTINFTLR